MTRLASALLTAAFAAATITPVLAKDHGGQGGAAPAAAAPAKTHSDAGGGKHADRGAAPQRVAPRRDVQQQRAPQERTIPVRSERQHFNAPPQRVAPQRVERQHVDVSPKHAEQQRFAPQERVRQARGGQHFSARQPFNEPQQFGVKAQKNRAERNHNDVVAPFAQVIRPRDEGRRTDYLSGRVVEVDNDAVVLENPLGQTFIVRGWHGRHNKHWRDRVLSMPVVYQNGAYYVYQPSLVEVAPATYTSYFYPADYGYATPYYPTSYGYTPAYGYAPDYAATNALSNVLSSVLGGSKSSLTNSLLTNYLASYVMSSLGGNTQSYIPGYDAGYGAPVYPAAYSSPLTYSYPMTCVYNDPYGGSSYDPSCAPVATQTYYTSPTAYAPAHVQGVVVASSGSSLMVLGANGMKPIVVNDAPALESGYAFNGQPQVGSVVSAYGFYQGNTFVATSLQ